eukprot:gnl/TRDRNA2_/TRDRNA2_177680_c4_seq9.p2 gnl/TRDRNA2_/TRDRNA2_177680_c4~~gnl/TRDRNA2_/TRDRNA2_177680_c4_seq9.p2  ORF type:complete len:549 (-),score=77.32 gnl/TRDRNA2_/TRDRNA2_177680_c4_seq9:237-1883(-)
MRQYNEAVDQFDIQKVAKATLSGSLESLNACVECCDRHALPGRIALFWEGADGDSATYTFSELRDQASRFAAFLANQGVGAGDCVAGLLPRRVELLITVLATWRLGAVYQPLFTAFGPKAIDHRLQTAGTRVVVTDGDNRGKLDGLESDPLVVTVGGDKGRGIRRGDFSFWAELESQQDGAEPVMRSADDPFLMMFTSSTTGLPKAVPVPLKAIVAFAGYMQHAVGLREDDAFWNLADPGWAYGLYYAVVGPLLMGHATHFNPGGFTPESTYDMIRKYKITNLAAAPTAYRLLKANDHVLPEGENLGLRVASSAGEPLNPEVVNWIRNRHFCPVKDHYGQTETGMTCCNFHGLEHPVREGSMGYASPGHKVVALNEKNEEVGEGEVGQLAVDVKASPLFHFDGYTWGEKDPFVNGYYLTGDMVINHGNGNFSFSGRDDDIITTAGYRVGPADVESTLLEHAAVAESGVVGKPDEKRGSIIKAYVVIKGDYALGDEQALKDELQELVRRRLSTHAFPREIEFVDELPKTPSGKIQRFVLRNQAKEEIGA